MTRAEWFTALAALAYPADRGRAELAFVPFLPWFDDLPVAAFTRASLEAVVTSPRKMAIPSYDEIRKPLAAWWRDNRAAELRLESEYARLETPVARGEPSPQERAAVAEMVNGLKSSTALGRSNTLAHKGVRTKAITLRDDQLLVEYERTASDERQPRPFRNLAAVRAKMLRERVGIDAVEVADV